MRHSLQRFVQILKSYLKLWPISEKVFIVPLSLCLIVIEVYDYKMRWHDSRRASHQQCDQLSCLGLDALLVLVILVVILTVIALASVLCVCHTAVNYQFHERNISFNLSSCVQNIISYYQFTARINIVFRFTMATSSTILYYFLFSTNTIQVFLRLKLLQISSYI